LTGLSFVGSTSTPHLLVDCAIFATRMCVRASPSVKVVKRLGLCITVEVFCRNCSFISMKWIYLTQSPPLGAHMQAA
jgi:hypothetical protein